MSFNAAPTATKALIMPNKTKIVCTMGPAVTSKEKILQLIDAGMNVARINFSHGTHEEHRVVFDLLKQARREKGVPLAIMLDTKGPEIRVGTIKGGQLPLKAGQKINLVAEECEGTAEKITIHPAHALDALKPGMKILFDDGYISGEVVEASSGKITIVCKNDAVLKTHKGVNIPGVNIDLPAMTEQDVDDITFGCEQEIDMIAASFIRSADHVLEIKRLLVSLGKPQIMLLAKIENRLGVENFDSIVRVADGIMVARGDLGVELPLEQVPVLQKMMIRQCNEVCKPVITATQMLESMTKNPRPTRAEVSDVANAIYDSTSAVMLSGETAVGLYPVETVEMMRRIVKETENDCDYKSFFEHEMRCNGLDVSHSVALSSVQTAYSAGAKAIFAPTNTGFTASLISRFRPAMPIIAQTSSETIYHQLAILWGVYPVPPATFKDAKESIQACTCFALSQGFLHWGDLVVLTAGSLFGVSGTTNMMTIENIGDVLVRGAPGHGKRVVGKAFLIHSYAEKDVSLAKGSIAVISRCDKSMAEVLKGAVGIVLQNLTQDPDSEQCALEIARKFDLPLVIRAAGSFKQLSDGMLITVDASRGLVFKGEVKSNDEMISTICEMKD